MPTVMGRPAAAMRRPAANLRRPAASFPWSRTEPDGPTGPYTRAGRTRRQYTWWMTMAFPYPETVQRLGLRTPDDFDHQSFLALVLEINEAANIHPLLNLLKAASSY